MNRIFYCTERYQSKRIETCFLILSYIFVAQVDLFGEELLETAQINQARQRFSGNNIQRCEEIRHDHPQETLTYLRHEGLISVEEGIMNK